MARSCLAVRPFAFVLILALAAATGPARAEAPLPDAANPDAVRDVRAGRRSVANAAWWGFDRQDATACLQAAIDSGAATVVVPYVGADWIVTPIKLRSGLELVFEPGVVVLAKKGAFRGKGDSMFTAVDAADITVRGYGATLRMRKKDYQREPYDKAEWRMTLDFMGCRRVRVEGVRLESSGGDGIYLGATAKLGYCADVVIRDVVCDDHHRQGISVISAVNLLIENCVLSNTGGTPPQAGIDFEPNHAREKLVNCVMRRCVMAGNRGAGVLVYLKNLSRESDPVSLRVEDCYIRGGADVGIGVGAVKDDGPKGQIAFVNCTIENTAKGGIFVYDKSADGARVRFVDCRWRDVGLGDGGKPSRRGGFPLLTTLLRPKLTRKHGGIDFVDCAVYDDRDRPVLKAEDEGSGLGVHDLQGRIVVHSPHSPRLDLPNKSSEIGLKVVPAGP